MDKKFDIGNFVDVLTEQRATAELVERFRRRRKECGHTQKSIADRSGVSYASVRRFETTGDISLNSLMMLAKAIDSLEDFGKLFTTPKIKNLKDYK